MGHGEALSHLTGALGGPPLERRVDPEKVLVPPIVLVHAQHEPVFEPRERVEVGREPQRGPLLEGLEVELIGLVRPEAEVPGIPAICRRPRLAAERVPQQAVGGVVAQGQALVHAGVAQVEPDVELGRRRHLEIGPAAGTVLIVVEEDPVLVQLVERQEVIEGWVPPPAREPGLGARPGAQGVRVPGERIVLDHEQRVAEARDVGLGDPGDRTVLAHPRDGAGVGASGIRAGIPDAGRVALVVVDGDAGGPLG